MLNITAIFQLSLEGIHSIFLRHSDKNPGLSIEYRGNGYSVELCKKIEHWCHAYTQGKPNEQLPLLMPKQTVFTQDVLKHLSKVAFGETLSYAKLASRAGYAKAYRAVGGVCRKNPFPLVIPCHRILASDGSLNGFAFGLEMKKELVEFEQSISN